LVPFSRALVTGGAGFIGSHIVDYLIKEGCEVTVLDDFSSGKIENLAQGSSSGLLSIVRGDIADAETVKEILKKDIDVVFHEAAIVNPAMEEEQLLDRVNVDGTINLLEESLKYSVRRFVFASSFAVYGNAKCVPIREIDKTRPISCYGEGKLKAERFELIRKPFSSG
jgi:nucleoside-diphosphate-sugar epimerase